jgi:hypothetical protein
LSDINSIGAANQRSGWRVNRISGERRDRDGGACGAWPNGSANGCAPGRGRHRSHTAHADEALTEAEDSMALLNIMLLTVFLILLVIAVAEIRDTHAAASPQRNAGSPAD